MLSKQNSTILIFDSGVGGLSIYYRMWRILPNFHYIYVFDNFAFPYGEKSEEFIIERILKIFNILQRQYFIILAIIACSTASTISLLSTACKKFPFPIIKVIPAIKLATSLTKNGVIGLLATKGTLKRSYIHKLIMYFAKKYKIELLGSTELTILAEMKLYGKKVPLEKLKYILKTWLCMIKPPDTIVLGCTHFSLLKRELSTILPKGINLIDSSSVTANRANWLIRHKTLNVKSTESNSAFCTEKIIETRYIISSLRNFGFKTLEKLEI